MADIKLPMKKRADRPAVVASDLIRGWACIDGSGWQNSPVPGQARDDEGFRALTDTR